MVEGITMGHSNFGTAIRSNGNIFDRTVHSPLTNQNYNQATYTSAASLNFN